MSDDGSGCMIGLMLVLVFIWGVNKVCDTIVTHAVKSYRVETNNAHCTCRRRKL